MIRKKGTVRPPNPADHSQAQSTTSMGSGADRIVGAIRSGVRRSKLPPRGKGSGAADLEIAPLNSCPVFWDPLSPRRE